MLESIHAGLDNMTISYANKRAGIANPIITPPASNLLFASDFTGAPSFGAWEVDGGTATRKLTGVDAATGYRWPTSGLGGNQNPGGCYGSSVIMIKNGVAAADVVTNNASYGSVNIGSEIGPSGGAENYLEMIMLDGAAFSGQIDLQFGRVSGGGYIPPDMTNLYMSYYFKFPASVFSALTANQSAILWDFKSGGYGGLYGGDFRLLNYLRKSSNGNIYSHVRADRSANGTMTNAPDGILPFVTTAGVFWYWDETDKTVPIPADTWVKFELFINRHEKTGIVLTAINDQIACRHVGRTLGEFGNVWGRLFPMLCYSYAAQTSVKVCQFRFRDYPPAGSVLQILAANLLDRYAA